MEVIHFGAGNIGRGFIAPILANSGATITFVDVNTEIIKALNTYGSYQVKILGLKAEEYTVTKVKGVLYNNNNTEAFIQANLITTAVGASVLPLVAEKIRQILVSKQQQNNTKPLNIMACENMLNASTTLKEYIVQELDENTKAFVEEYVGFVNCVVDRIVPPQKTTTNILNVAVEDFYEWVADKTSFKGELPTIKGIIFTDSLNKYVERKIFTVNTGHAVTAYLGYLKGKPTVHEAMADPQILKFTKGVMKESAKVLFTKYNFAEQEHYEYINKIIKRFQNPYIVDEVTRVAREPLRKLGKNERLVMPLLGTMQYNLPNDNLIFAIACTLAYNYSEDLQAVKLQGLINNNGFKQAITEITSITDVSLLNKISQARVMIPAFVKGDETIGKKD